MSSSKHQSPPATSVWKAKNTEKSDETKESTADSKRNRRPSSKPREFKKRGEYKKSESANDQKFTYQAKLMTEEDEENKTCLIKISSRTSIR